jgi:hypothetical protein
VSNVTMVLAYAQDRPEGDVSDRLEMKAVLTPQGQIDEQAWLADPLPWPATRTLPDGTTRPAEVVQVDTGWALRGTHADDDPLWTLNGRVFRPGELITVHLPTGADLIFRVVNVETE